MTSSISWIDRAGLAETLARLGPAATGPSPKPRSSVGTSRLRPAAETREAGDARPAFDCPDGPLRQRLDAFIDWLIRVEASRVAFIIDRDGLPLIDRAADADLLEIASSMMQLVDRLNRKLLADIGQTVTLQLEEGLLVLIAVATPIGHYFVGHVGERAPDQELQAAAADALRRAFRPSARRPVSHTSGADSAAEL